MHNRQNGRLEKIHRIHCHSKYSQQTGPLNPQFPCWWDPSKNSFEKPTAQKVYLAVNTFRHVLSGEVLPSLRKFLVYAKELNQTKWEQITYLILVSLWVLSGLHAEGHDHDRRRRTKIFNHIHQARLHGHSLHLTPADWLTGRLWGDNTNHFHPSGNHR